MSELALRKRDSGTAQDMIVDFINIYVKGMHDITKSLTGSGIIDNNDSVYKQDKRIYPLWNFAIGRRPLSASPYFEGEHWFVEVDDLDLDVTGYGATPAEAIAELEQHIRHFIKFYKDADDDDLTAYTRSLRERFSRIIIKD